MKNFLLYAGCGRAGSTWLYGELNDRGDCDFSHIKEHFMFLDFTLEPQFDKKSFFQYYSELAKNPQTKLLGEMSPSNGYATLEQLIWFKEEAIKKNFNVLPVMTLRDPIDQFASVVKLTEGTRLVKEMVGSDRHEDVLKVTRQMREGIIPRPKIELTFDVLQQHFNKTPFSEREFTWETTINNFVEVFGKIHIQFYETLFTETSMQLLCDYLEIPMSNFNYSLVRNKQGESASLTDAEKQIIFDQQQFVSTNYQFAIDRFGKEFIESIWWTPNK